MKFIDLTEIFIKSGPGGKGLVSFRRARNKPRLGPDGGDGGFGGSVYLVGDEGLNTLSSLRYKKTYKAEKGMPGGSNGKTGHNGKDCIIKVPTGTVVFNKETGERICEVTRHAQKVLIAKGGKRGLGNQRFVSSIHQAPEEFTEGGPEIALSLRLELKLIADIGFAGLPNAGKSTLLSRISSAKPKIADYPFTTLTPQLGVVNLDMDENCNYRSFVAADIPGLIKGASKGLGLGHEFLRHLERTKIITYVIDGFNSNPLKSYYQLKSELYDYDVDLIKKPCVIVITKCDLATLDFKKIQTQFKDKGLTPIFISAVTGFNIKPLKEHLYDLLKKQKPSADIKTNDYPINIPSLEEFELVN